MSVSININLSYDLEEKDEQKNEAKAEESGTNVGRRPSFMEPIPTSPKKVIELVSVLMKRAHSVAFGDGGDAMYKDYEIGRYGQPIGADFFVTNYGHAVYCPQAKNVEQVKFYKENKNLFKV